MPNPIDPDDDSTLLRVGKSAVTFTEMEQFVRDIESRPLDRFVDDLPSLRALPEAKYNLVASVVRKRLRGSDERGTREIVRRIQRIEAGSVEPKLRKRCASLLKMIE